jgi:uncharacterized membrane protein YfcA
MAKAMWHVKNIWIIPVASLILPPVLLLAARALNYAGRAPKGAWFLDVMVVAPTVCLIVSALTLLATLILWLSGVTRFREVRLAMAVSLLGSVVNVMIAIFIFSRLRY